MAHFLMLDRLNALSDVEHSCAMAALRMPGDRFMSFMLCRVVFFFCVDGIQAGYSWYHGTGWTPPTTICYRVGSVAR